MTVRRRVFLRRASVLLGGLLLPMFTGCSGSPDSGPVAVQWDRDTCDYCRMVISDVRYAAQVRGSPRGQVYRFDDIGCALNWLAAHPPEHAAEIWVADHRHHHGVRWLDARIAHYLSGQRTPMDYGFGAQDLTTADSVSFDTVRLRVLAKDQSRGR